MEEWKAIPGYEKLYSVSNMGQIRGEEKTRDRGRGIRARVKGRILAQHVGPFYNTVCLVRPGSKKTMAVHSLVLLAFVGPLKDCHCARHIDGNSRNNKLSNLAYGTYSENIADKETHGTKKEGANHYKSILSRAQAKHILESKGKKTIYELAKEFCVKPSTISKIHTRKNWKCLSA